ncbi:MAG: metalloenzyme [Armatimonadetes bacterium]|nr:metalloenzyme [Armatimonadota bacterium]
MRGVPRILMVFVDGLGLGTSDAGINPLVRARTPHLDRLLGGRRLVASAAAVRSDRAIMVPIDATLGVDGLPQSATGQTSLLTGVNAARLVGRHVQAYPTRALQRLLEEHNLFRRLREAARCVALANVYTDDYFQAVSARRLRHGAVTFSAMAAGVRLHTLEDLRAGRAVFHDLTNERLRERGYDVPLIAPAEAGRRLAAIAAAHDFTFFEFFLTDLVAHGRVPLDPARVVERLDCCLGAIVEAADLAATLILLASDHGNIEDGRSGGHSRNPVPVLLVGCGRERAAAGLRDLTHVAPAILHLQTGALHGDAPAGADGCRGPR